MLSIAKAEKNMANWVCAKNTLFVSMCEIVLETPQIWDNFFERSLEGAT